MHFTKKTVSEKRSGFVKDLQSKKLLRFPGAYNPLCAKLIAEIGFEGVYVSGGVMSNDLGLPDIGLTTLEQVSYRSGQISRVTDLPTIVDIDTGFGNCKKTIEEFEKKGLAGCHIEDQVSQKRCGHRPNKEIVPVGEMIDRIKAAVDAKIDNDFVVMARTDALANEGLDLAIERAVAYQEAGADALFPEAFIELDQYRELKKHLKIPILANITEFGKTPLFGCEELSQSGVDMVLYPLTAFRAMSKAAEEVFKEIKMSDNQESLLKNMQTRDELYDVLDYHSFENKLDDLFKN